MLIYQFSSTKLDTGKLVKKANYIINKISKLNAIVFYTSFCLIYFVFCIIGLFYPGSNGQWLNWYFLLGQFVIFLLIIHSLVVFSVKSWINYLTRAQVLVDAWVVTQNLSTHPPPSNNLSERVWRRLKSKYNIFSSTVITQNKFIHLHVIKLILK